MDIEEPWLLLWPRAEPNLDAQTLNTISVKENQMPFAEGINKQRDVPFSFSC